jgi:gamma-glutamyltranspeptidase/glutathione hydrolase
MKYLILFCLLSVEHSFAQNTRGVVSSAHPMANAAGMKILENGGNAFDAAIAMASTLNVVEPMMSGLGGYGTILIYDAKKKQIRFLNCSGKIPVNTNSDLMRPPTVGYKENRHGAKSVSTPGNLHAWRAMHDEYGLVKWDQLFTDAINIADTGFVIDRVLAMVIGFRFNDFSDYSKSFYGRNGKPIAFGDKLIQKDLSGTYKQIAKEGVDIFYKGSIAKTIDKAMQEKEGFLRLVDLQNDKAAWWDPIKYSYKGYDVYTASPPSNAFAGLVALGLMDQFRNRRLQPNSLGYFHVLAEICKRSYVSRLKYSGDPDIHRIPLDSILSPAFLSQEANRMDTAKASVFTSLMAGNTGNHTTHFVVMDKWGNIVSATQTLGELFGSGIMPAGTGIWLNNSLAYCTYEPKGNPMDAFPGHHKLSGDCPVIIIKDNLPWAALGTPGGHTITQNIPQIIFNLVDFKMSMQEAIDAPKIAFQEPDVLAVESAVPGTEFKGVPQSVQDGLKKKGHHVITENVLIGNAHGIKIIRNAKGEITSFEVGADNRMKF